MYISEQINKQKRKQKCKEKQLENYLNKIFERHEASRGPSATSEAHVLHADSERPEHIVSWQQDD